MLDVFALHGLGGIARAILTGAFAAEAIGGTGGPIEGNATQVGLQVLGVAVTIVYCAIVSFIISEVVDAVVGLRIETEVERDGLDLELHGEAVP